MTTAKEVLALIEGVDPEDTAKLDEIDARVACYVQEHPYGAELTNYLLKTYPKYTRDRNALKAIRPKPDGGWWIWETWVFTNTARTTFTRHAEFGTRFTPSLPTEELAELHAIIQSIEWERNHG